MSKAKIISLVKKKFKALNKKGILTGIEQVDKDILKVFIDYDFFGYFSLHNLDFLSTDDDRLRCAPENEDIFTV